MMNVPNKWRHRGIDNFGTNENDGNNGLFIIPFGSDILQCIASDGREWEHVSVTVRTKNRAIHSISTWEQMCYIKNLFWNEEDIVVQYHPKKSEYVNNHPYVLHLWCPIKIELPYPNSILVGIKNEIRTNIDN